MRRGCLYLVAIMNWYSCKVLARRLSNRKDANFCPLGRLLYNRLSVMVEALKEAAAKHGKPEIFSTDQGSQFTSCVWIDVLTDAKIKISMPPGDFANHLPVIDGKGAWRDNRMIERLRRSLK